ncbi:MAG: Trm112 family protein [Cypionkella sp.]
MTGNAPIAAPVAAYDRRMLEALVCPRTQTSLRFDAEKLELISDAAQLAFPIRNGIPIMLISAARVLE